MDPAEGRRGRLALALAPCGAILLLWVTAFLAWGSIQKGPRDTGLGGDFATFYTASRMVTAAQNPYNQKALFQTERQVWAAQRLARPRYESYIRAGNPPLFYWALGLLTRFDFRTAAWIWIALMYVLCAIGGLAALRACGWTKRGWACAFFLLMPQTVLAAYYGNVDALVFAALALAISLGRNRPALAGILLTAAWLKPQYALPLALLVLIFLLSRPARAALWFALASSVAAIMTLLTTGVGSLEAWIVSLAGLAGHTNAQPDLISLSGLYVYSASSTLQRVLSIATLIVAGALTVCWMIRTRHEPRGDIVRSGWLWALWLLAAPLAHFHYEIVLAIPLFAVFGANGANVRRGGALALMYLLLLSVFLFPTNRAHSDLQSLTLIPAVLILARAATRKPHRSMDQTVTGNRLAGVAGQA